MQATGGLVVEDAVVSVRALAMSYRQGDERQQVLRDVSFTVTRGAFVAVMGPSGCGKSTLLHLVGGLDVPDGGEVSIGGRSLASMTDDERTKLRRSEIGIVYQFFNLVPVLDVEENVALPAAIAGARPGSYEDRVAKVLGLVGLAGARRKVPAQLSGGEQQRVAIARALVIEPSVLLADEPTGNLDGRTGAEVLGLIDAAVDTLGQTVVMVTHDSRAAAHADEVLFLHGGTIATRLRFDQVLEAGRRGSEGRAKAVLRWLEDAEDSADGVG